MLRAGGAPRTPALRTLKASAGQSGGPGGCRKAFPVPSAPAEEKYRRWGRGGGEEAPTCPASQRRGTARFPSKPSEKFLF